MMWNDGSWGAGGWLAMSFMMLIFWGAVIALVMWALRSTRTGSRTPTNDPTQRADAVLAERFARGEIDEEEFTQRRRLLHTTGERS